MNVRSHLRLDRAAAAAAVAVVVLAAAAAPAAAGLDIDFGAAVALDDDVRIFLNVSTRYFDADAAGVEATHRRLRRPEDVAVAYFVAQRAGVALRVVLRERDRGATWFRIAIGLGLEPDVFFLTSWRNPGPPYGKAYGHYKKHRGARPSTWDLDDDSIRELVVLRMTCDYYGLSAEVAAGRRPAASTAVVLVADEYRARHGGPKAGGTPPGHAQPHGKGHAAPPKTKN